MGLNDVYKEYQKLYHDYQKQYQDINREPSKHLLQASEHLADLTKEKVDQARAMWSAWSKEPAKGAHAAAEQGTDPHFRPEPYRSPVASLAVKCSFTGFSMPMPWQ